MYFIAGVFTQKIFILLQYLTKQTQTVVFMFLFIGILLFLTDTISYFKWMKEDSLKNARQPALTYEEFSLWQDYQIERIKNNKNPITNYEWYEIRKKLIN